MELSLHQATLADLLIVKNLVPYYIYDMSEYMGWPCGADGSFEGCQFIETYWSEAGKHAFVLRSGNELGGFAMVRGNHAEPEIDYSIAEFFVLRKFRGQGTGERIARHLFDRFRGRWMVEQLELNQPAVSFWRKVIHRYCDGTFEQRVGKSNWGTMNVILFQNKLTAEPCR
jgi:predicted acetyltransferase